MTVTAAVLQVMIVATCALYCKGDTAEPHSRVKRVIGGTGFTEGKWPWLVSLQGKVPDRVLFGVPLSYQRLYCGASLLNERWILTAAHCFTETRLGSRARTPKYWHAKIGEIELQSGLLQRLQDKVGKLLSIDELRHYYLHAEKIILHPSYDRDRLWQHDVALIKLEEDVPSSAEILPAIQSIPLINSNNMSFPTVGQDCVMKGWGCTANGGPLTGTAQEAVVPKVDDADCERFWGSGITTAYRLCAGQFSASGVGICSGDSGGPLVCHDGEKWVQVGIASFTSSSRPGNVPGVFTRVSRYVDWIHHVIASE